MDHPASPDIDPHAPASAGACALVPPDAGNVRRIGGDLLDQLELAGRRELQALLDAVAPDGAHAAPLDPVESVIAWDLAAGF
ncbi:hypothetical protein [Luteimonas deserti]|uniref:Uncharacterized protein n=1 Tax=Luteimonas deserti TaxID=2752306 RepID=A0A7Z0QSY6_9GAMM|nr:hypothetical protein [Luteimonas deserti]NYZ64331.1 hypothetical protein [Luteimonas deserti]